MSWINWPSRSQFKYKNGIDLSSQVHKCRWAILVGEFVVGFYTTAWDDGGRRGGDDQETIKNRAGSPDEWPGCWWWLVLFVHSNQTDVSGFCFDANRNGNRIWKRGEVQLVRDRMNRRPLDPATSRAMDVLLVISIVILLASGVCAPPVAVLFVPDITQSST